MTIKELKDGPEIVISKASAQSTSRRSSLRAKPQPQAQEASADLETKSYLEEFKPLFPAAKERLTELLQIDDPRLHHQEELEILSATLLALSSEEADPFHIITDILTELSDLTEHNKLRFFLATMKYDISVWTQWKNNPIDLPEYRFLNVSLKKESATMIRLAYY